MKPIPVLGLPVLNRGDLLERLVKSIDYPIAKFVIINNGNDASVLEAIEKIQNGLNKNILSCEVYTPEKNLGVAPSWNYIITSNPDAPYWVIGSNDMVFTQAGSVQNMAEYIEENKTTHAVIYAHAHCFFCVTQEGKKSVGLFDENIFPAYLEDCDHSYRIKLSGAVSSNIPDVHMHHGDDVSGGSCTIISDKKYSDANVITHGMNFEYYQRKWGSVNGAEVYTHPFNNPLFSIDYWELDVVERKKREEVWGIETNKIKNNNHMENNEQIIEEKEIVHVKNTMDAKADYLTLLRDSLLDRIYGSIGIDDSAVTEEYIIEGAYHPKRAHTMIGEKRLNNIRWCVEDVLQNNIEGDLIETGVWRGGATIFMRGILKHYGITDRKVFVADSFEGLPKPEDEKYPADIGDGLWACEYLKVSMKEVAKNFWKYHLFDNQVVFLKGFFEKSLPNAPINKLAVLRLDGDMYSSTMQVLDTLYDKLSVGGYIIIDDYVLIPCRKAVTDFRKKRGITTEIEYVDDTGVCWKKEEGQ